LNDSDLFAVESDDLRVFLRVPDDLRELGFRVLELPAPPNMWGAPS
jgi:hypothetical protein